MKSNKIAKRLLALALLPLTLTACSAQTADLLPGKKAAAAAAEIHWSYEGDTGPEHWGSLDPSFSRCADGTEQSPIDIELASVKLDKTLQDVEAHYKPTAFTLANTGHTIQLNDASGSNSIVLDGKTYKLVQIHFHKPSENEINGQSFDMEMHLVHKSADGQLAVLGVLIKAGKENKQLAEAWSKLPKEQTAQDIKLDKAIDLAGMLPEGKKAYRYDGSLTTPPCTEGVKWVVMDTPIELSIDQIHAFGAIFPDNHRPVQPLNNRTLIESSVKKD